MAEVFERIPDPTPELLAKCRAAEPPPRVPRGFFDGLVRPTRHLLDRGLRLSQAADFLIAEKILQPRLRAKYMNALRTRMTRLRARKALAGEVFHWRSGLGYEEAHAVGHGTIAACGARAGLWMNATDTSRQCRRCKGIMKAQKVKVKACRR